MSSVVAVVFDLDNTLLDRTSAVRGWLNDHVGLSGEELERALVEDDSGYRERAEFFGWLSGVTGRGADELWGNYRQRIGECVAPDETMLRVVARVAQDYEVGILTNGTAATQWPKIAALALESVVPRERIWVSDEIGFWKPARGAFEFVLDALGGLRPDSVLHVGDDPNNDVRGALHAGMRAAWFSHGRTNPFGSEVAVYRDLTDFAQRFGLARG